MCFHSWYLLRQSKNMSPRTKMFYIVYGFTMLILSMFAWMGNALAGQLMWINHRDYPGGPLAYYSAESTSWFSILSTATPVVQNFMNDGLLVRFLIRECHTTPTDLDISVYRYTGAISSGIAIDG